MLRLIARLLQPAALSLFGFLVARWPVLILAALIGSSTNRFLEIERVPLGPTCLHLPAVCCILNFGKMQLWAFWYKDCNVLHTEPQSLQKEIASRPFRTPQASKMVMLEHRWSRHPRYLRSWPTLNSGPFRTFLCAPRPLCLHLDHPLKNHHLEIVLFNLAKIAPEVFQMKQNAVSQKSITEHPIHGYFMREHRRLHCRVFGRSRGLCVPLLRQSETRDWNLLAENPAEAREAQIPDQSNVEEGITQQNQTIS